MRASAGAYACGMGRAIHNVTAGGMGIARPLLGVISSKGLLGVGATLGLCRLWFPLPVIVAKLRCFDGLDHDS
jgi:hypothetical protein